MNCKLPTFQRTASHVLALQYCYKLPPHIINLPYYLHHQTPLFHNFPTRPPTTPPQVRLKVRRSHPSHSVAPHHRLLSSHRHRCHPRNHHPPPPPRPNRHLRPSQPGVHLPPGLRSQLRRVFLQGVAREPHRAVELDVFDAHVCSGDGVFGAGGEAGWVATGGGGGHAGRRVFGERASD